MRALSRSGGHIFCRTFRRDRPLGCHQTLTGGWIVKMQFVRTVCESGVI
jgi:hypothetical protein